MFHVVRLDWVNLADQGLPGNDIKETKLALHLNDSPTLVI